MAETPWPPVATEERPWRTNPDLRGPDGARPNRRERELSSITVTIPVELIERTPQLASSTVALAEDAAQRITALESRADHLGGLGELLVRTEAVASSKIEHIHAEMDDIARATIGEAAGDKARRTVAAGLALTELTDSCGGGAPLTEAAILSAHHHLLANDRLEGAWAGRYRQQQNWIGGSDLSPLGAVHIPPPHQLVPGLMTDMVDFANRNDMSAVAQAAIVHAQFETIHPFTDGNGRVGRGLIGAVLRRRGLTRGVTVPVAAAMLADVDRYFDQLGAYRSGDVDAIVAYVAGSAIAAAEASVESADRLAELPAHWADAVQARRGSSARTLVDGLLKNPILDIHRASAVTGSTKIRTYEALDRLQSTGVLDEITGAGRNRIWVAGDVMTELRALEERIGRRSRPSRDRTRLS
ncbi:Fic family protein [Nocardioides sp.]|uniref:Fic family protein n=1 Tax=Nocardioides sp. TaxID=35761 RepID=UPI002CF41474|nr:Fic family protein [Nocardioides sp.]HSX68921.1 Fic family protein [Nocardioides sp.]